MLEFTGFTELLLTGALAGLIAGFFGVGGGIILTPLCLLVYPALGVERQDLIKIIFGTNMILATAFSLSAVIMYAKKESVLWRAVLFLSPFAVLGSIAGPLSAAHTDPTNLKKAFAVLLILSSFLMLGKKTGTYGESEIHKKPLLSENYLPFLGLLTGFIGSYLGIGGGLIMIAPLVILFGYPIKKVAGTSSAVIIFVGITATIGYMNHGSGNDLPGISTGYVWWSAALPLVIGGIPTARLGAWLNSRTKSRILRILFSVVMIAVGLKILVF